MRKTRMLGVAVLLVLASAPVAEAAAPFDLQAHRGGPGLRPENTLASFGSALRRGVSTLEPDTGVTKDGVVVVSHERRISSLECQGPYVGKRCTTRPRARSPRPTTTSRRTRRSTTGRRCRPCSSRA